MIKQVKETQNSKGGDMIVIYFDFDVSDAQGGLFMKQFKEQDTKDRDGNPRERKWPFAGTAWINVNDSEGKCSRKFKTFCTAVEDSNAGFKAWDSKDQFNAIGFKDKKVGAVFGEVLDWYDGRETTKVQYRWFCDVNKALDANVPDPIETQEHKNANKASVDADGFMNIPDGIDEDLPFN